MAPHRTPFKFGQRQAPKVVTATALIVVFAATACTRVPEIEDQLTKDLRAQPYPALQPLDRTLAAQPAPEVAVREVQDDLAARSRRLKARADALRKREI